MPLLQSFGYCKALFSIQNCFINQLESVTKRNNKTQQESQTVAAFPCNFKVNFWKAKGSPVRGPP